MTQHTPSSNTRNASNPSNTNSSVLYSHKTRGTHTRVSRVKVTTVGKTPYPEKQLRSCPRCKESSNSMKILTARVGRIEELVNNLAETTRELAAMSKRDDRFTQNNMKFARLDLTRCTLQELQKLVVATTKVMAPNKSTSPESIVDAGSDEETITEEPMPMEDVKSTGSRDALSNNKKPEKPDFKELAKRQDSGFAEAAHFKKPIRKVSDNAPSLD